MKPIQVSPRAYSDIRYLEDWLAERASEAATRIGPMLFAAMKSLDRIEPDRVIIATVHHSLERR